MDIDEPGNPTPCAALLGLVVETTPLVGLSWALPRRSVLGHSTAILVGCLCCAACSTGTKAAHGPHEALLLAGTHNQPHGGLLRSRSTLACAAGSISCCRHAPGSAQRLGCLPPWRVKQCTVHLVCWSSIRWWRRHLLREVWNPSRWLEMVRNSLWLSPWKPCTNLQGG